MTTINTKLITGKTETFTLTPVAKDRVRMVNAAGTAMAIVYLRNTPSISEGQGYRVTGVVPVPNVDAAKTCGAAMNTIRPALESFGKRIVEECRAAMNLAE